MLYQYNQGYKSLLQYMIRDRKSQDKMSQTKSHGRKVTGQKVTV